MATRTASAKKAARKTGRINKRNPSATPPARRWSAKVTTDSTHPEHDLFNQDAATVAKSLASKKVSPKGPASGMRMLNFYINRAGSNLSADRHRELEKAKDILSVTIAQRKHAHPAKKLAAGQPAPEKSNPKKYTA